MRSVVIINMACKQPVMKSIIRATNLSWRAGIARETDILDSEFERFGCHLCWTFYEKVQIPGGGLILLCRCAKV